MFDNPEKLFIILLIALFIFGPQKLIGLGASMGKAIREFRGHVREAQDQFHSAVAEAHTEAMRTEEAFTTSEPPALPAPDPFAQPASSDGTQSPQPATATADAGAEAPPTSPTSESERAASAPPTAAGPADEDEGRHSLASEPSSQAVLELLQRKT